MTPEEERKKRVIRELELLAMPKWRWKEIREFYQCASAKANKIRKAALAIGGKIDYDPHAVQSRFVLKLDGTTPEIEIRKRHIELTGLSQQETESNNQ